VKCGLSTSRNSALLLAASRDEPLHGPVISSLYLSREVACRKLARIPVVLYAFTADALPGARLVGAVATGLVVAYLTFAHLIYPSSS